MHIPAASAPLPDATRPVVKLDPVTPQQVLSAQAPAAEHKLLVVQNGDALAPHGRCWDPQLIRNLLRYLAAINDSTGALLICIRQPVERIVDCDNPFEAWGVTPDCHPSSIRSATVLGAHNPDGTIDRHPLLVGYGLGRTIFEGTLDVYLGASEFIRSKGMYRLFEAIAGDEDGVTYLGLRSNGTLKPAIYSNGHQL